jgi:hypothetical protein
MNSKRLTLFSVGDVILEPEPEKLLKFVKNTMKDGDVVLGQMEVTYTNRGKGTRPAKDPALLDILPKIGFNTFSLAGNHFCDGGVEGIEDTIAWLKRNNIPYTGGGMNLAEAKKPAFLECDGTRFGFLDYNCVGPVDSWATKDKPGTNYINVLTHYEGIYASPGAPPDVYTWAEPKMLKMMKEEIRQLRPQCDVLVVSYHMGLGHTPIKIAAYEKEIAYAAIDTGADLICGHHAHILKGIEIYKGKPIYYGLGNFATSVPGLAPKPDQDPDSWQQKRMEVFGFAPDPRYPTYPFHPEAINTVIAKCIIENGKIVRASYLPCIINTKAQPKVLKNDKQGQKVFNYVEKISKGAKLNSRFEWDGDEVLVLEK